MFPIPSTNPQIPDLLGRMQELQIQRAQMQAARLANARSQQTLQYAGPQAKATLRTSQAAYPKTLADTALAIAQAQKTRGEALHPWASKAGSIPPIQTARLYYQHQVQTYGHDSPEAKNALGDLNRMSSAIESTTQRNVALSKSQAVRALTTPGKTFVEQAQLGAGYSPTGQQWSNIVGNGVTGPQAHGSLDTPTVPASVTPQQQASIPQRMIQTQFGQVKQAPGPLPPIAQQAAAQTAMYRVKQMTDSDARKRMRFANNVDNSFKYLNAQAPQALQYAGIMGHAKLGEDKIKAMAGTTTPQLQHYINFKKSVDFLKGQLIQFYNQSKQPEKAKDVGRLIDSIDLTGNPQQARDTLSYVERIYNRERQTYREAATNQDFYTKARPSIEANLNQQFQQQAGGPKQAQPVGKTQLSSQQPSFPSGVTQHKLEYTARKHGMTVDQVKQRLGIR